MAGIVDDVVEGDRVRVMQPGREPGLADHSVPGQPHLLIGQSGLDEQLLYRYRALQQFIPALPDEAHSADGYPLDKAVAVSKNGPDGGHLRPVPAATTM